MNKKINIQTDLNTVICLLYCLERTYDNLDEELSLDSKRFSCDWILLKETKDFIMDIFDQYSDIKRSEKK